MGAPHLEVNGLELRREFEIIEMAQAVENVYTGSPCDTAVPTFRCRVTAFP